MGGARLGKPATTNAKYRKITCLGMGWRRYDSDNHGFLPQTPSALPVFVMSADGNHCLIDIPDKVPKAIAHHCK
jgi:hypothetical protein